MGRCTWNHNFGGFGIPWEERTTRLHEAIDILERAWAAEPLSFHRHYLFEAVDVVPKLFQQPGPPLHIAANSPETAVFAGERGLRLLMATPIHPWPDDFLTHLHRYRDIAARGASANATVTTVFFVFPADDRAAVCAQMEASFSRHPIGRNTSYETAERSMAIFGSPAECIDKVASIQHRAKLDCLLCSFNPGGTVPHAQVKTAMRRFAKEVIPHLRHI